MRPTVRPSKPLTFDEITSAVHTHFFEEKNPQCRDSHGDCVYGLTGCAVGCLLTQEDADAIDSVGLMSLDSMSRRFSEIYTAYFTEDQLGFLTALQNWHDSPHRFGDLAKFQDVVECYRKEASCC